MPHWCTYRAPIAIWPSRLAIAHPDSPTTAPVFQGGRQEAEREKDNEVYAGWLAKGFETKLQFCLYIDAESSFQHFVTLESDPETERKDASTQTEAAEWKGYISKAAIVRGQETWVTFPTQVLLEPFTP